MLLIKGGPSCNRIIACVDLLAAKGGQADYQIFNVGGAKATTVLEYAHALAEKLDRDIEPVIPGQFRFGDSRHIISDISKLRALGWEPATPLEQIVEEYIAWAQGEPDIKDYYAEAERSMKEMGAIRVA